MKKTDSAKNATSENGVFIRNVPMRSGYSLLVYTKTRFMLNAILLYNNDMRILLHQAYLVFCF